MSGKFPTSFLGSSYDNLLTLDILCHAVSSPKVFEKLKLYVKISINHLLILLISEIN